MSERNPQRRRLGYRLTQWFVRTLFKVLFGLKIEGRSNIPRAGGFILTCNHQSWFDPPIVGSSCPRELYYAAKRQLFTIPVLGFLIKYYNSIPVNRTGFDRRALTELGKVLGEGFGIIVFPEGTRFSDGRLHPGKPGVGLLAVNYAVPIVPAFVCNSARISRQFFRRRLVLRFGEPFRIPAASEANADKKEAVRRTTELIMKRIAAVGNVPEPIEPAD